MTGRSTGGAGCVDISEIVYWLLEVKALIMIVGGILEVVTGTLEP
jgi:hypothetical protein